MAPLHKNKNKNYPLNLQYIYIYQVFFLTSLMIIPKKKKKIKKFNALVLNS
jgi:hypothetical protein